jgi:hypothetical protein
MPDAGDAFDGRAERGDNGLSVDTALGGGLDRFCGRGGLKKLTSAAKAERILKFYGTTEVVPLTKRFC